MTGFHDLPEELLWLVITELDGQPPSALRMNDQPSVELLFSKNHPLKNLSCVSQSFRRLALPMLFKHMRLPICDLLPRGYKGTADQKAIFLLKHPSIWMPASQDFFRFIEMYGLKRHIVGLVIFAEADVAELSSSYLLDHVGGSMNYTLTLVKCMWQQLLNLTNPSRLVIFAPPRSLGSLLSLYIDTSDAWSFNIDCQIVEMLRSSKTSTTRSESEVTTSSFSFKNLDISDHVKPQMLVTMSSWSSIAYNEGSSLNAYGTYHYFEKRPPCVLLGDPRLLNPNAQHSTLKGLGARQFYLTTLTRFTYMAIFPHFAHFSHILLELSSLPKLRELCLQLAPVAGNGLLDDSEKIGKGNLSLRDCWSEVERCYIVVVELIARENPPWIKFESSDCGIYELSTDLDKLFEQRAPEWTRHGKGVWCKQETQGEACTTTNVSDELSRLVI